MLLHWLVVICVDLLLSKFEVALDAALNAALNAALKAALDAALDAAPDTALNTAPQTIHTIEPPRYPHFHHCGKGRD